MNILFKVAVGAVLSILVMMFFIVIIGMWLTFPLWFSALITILLVLGTTIFIIFAKDV